MDDQSGIIKMLSDLIAFRTVTSDQKEVRRALEHLDAHFEWLPVERKILEHNGVFSLLVSMRGRDWQKPHILLNGHIDVVSASETEFSPRVEKNRLYGRGAQDMKGGLVALIMAFKECMTEPNPPDVALLITGDEEIGGADGTGYVVGELGIRPDFVLVGDGSQRDYWEIITKEKGGLWIEMIAEGVNSHAARPWLGDNAIDKIIAAIESVKRLVGPVEHNQWKSTASVTVIGTDNTVQNMIPARARAVMDIRFTEGLADTPDEVLREVVRWTPDVAVRAMAKVPLFMTDEDHPMVRRFADSAHSVYKKGVSFGFSHAASDARYFSEAGIPTVIFGTVGDKWHADGEWVDLESVELMQKIVTEFLRASTEQRKV